MNEISLNQIAYPLPTLLVHDVAYSLGGRLPKMTFARAISDYVVASTV